MLRTSLCDFLRIDVPIIQAAMAACTSAELVSTVSNAGGLGTLASALISIEDFKSQLVRTAELTARAFAVNHSIPFFKEETFAATLAAKPAVISFALGDPGDLVARAHDAGIKVMQMVNTVEQAARAVTQGADIINAQGTEAGGFSGTISTMILIPQVVDVVGDVPVVASGGIFDGRGLAAAITLGAQGVALGTRFLASVEAPIDDTWKSSITTARSDQVVRVPGWNEVFPLTSSRGYDVAPNSLQTPFTEECGQVRGLGESQTKRLNGRLMAAVREGKFFELVPLTGQTAGAIRGIESAGNIVQRIATEAEASLKRAAGHK